MMKKIASLSLALVFAGLALSGCKKPEAPRLPTPIPTPAPPADKDILAFTRGGQLWIMKTDGSAAAPLAAQRDASFWFPEASPKGADFIAWLSRGDGTQNLVRITLDGKVTELTSIDTQANSAMKNLRLGNAARYDSQAQRIAYSFNGTIWIMNRDGENAETLISDGNSYAPAWSPDDKKIAYVNGKNGHYDLWVTDVASHDTYQVTDFQDYTVGQPRWMAGGQRILLTRSQKDDSDIVSVVSETDQPLVDADVITSDHVSSSAVMDSEGKHMLFSSARKNPPAWEICLGDASAKDAKVLTDGGGVSPAWLKPSASVQLPPSLVAAMPTHVPTPAPKATSTPVAIAVAVTPAATHVAVAPLATPKPVLPVAQATKAPINSKPAPTKTAASHPVATVKAPPLRLRIKAGFDPESDEVQLSGLTELKKLAGRVQQYAGESIQVYGPLDRSPLKGRYASFEERSQARASQIASQLAKDAKMNVANVQALPYTPVSLEDKVPNGIQIYVVLK